MSAVIPSRNPFPRAAAIALGVLVVLGFARTYYLRVLAGLPPLGLALHVHGLIASAWMALHYTQARLVARHRVTLHRQLGAFTAVLGYALVIEAYLVAYLGLRAGHAPPGRDPLQFFSVPMSTTTIFGVLLTAALVMRRKREWHKRLMFLATLGMLIPALGRLELQVFRPLGMPPFLGTPVIVAGLLVWACINDWRRTRRVHPAYAVLGTLFLLTIPGRVRLGFTEPWMDFARWVAGL